MKFKNEHVLLSILNEIILFVAKLLIMRLIDRPFTTWYTFVISFADPLIDFLIKERS